MYGTQPGPSSHTAPQPSPPRRAARVGSVRYVPMPRPLGPEARKDAMKAKCARSHYLRLARFVELACNGIDEFRQELKNFTEELEKHRVVRSETRKIIVRLEKPLREETLEYMEFVQKLTSRVEASHVDVLLVVGGSDSDLASEEDYEGTEEVFVTVPERRGRARATLHGLGRSFRRVHVWLRRGGRQQRDVSRSDEETSPLRTQSSKTLDKEQKSSTSEDEEEQPSAGDQAETPAVAQPLAENDAANSDRADSSDEDTDEGSNENGDGPGKETGDTEEVVDVEDLKESPQDGVLREICRLYGTLRRTLLLHVKVLHVKINERWELERQSDERWMTRLVVAHQMNTLIGLEAHMGEALLLMAGNAKALRQLGAQAWPAEPPLPLPLALLRRRGLQQPARRRCSAFWRICSLTCCVRGRR